MNVCGNYFVLLVTSFQLNSKNAKCQDVVRARLENVSPSALLKCAADVFTGHFHRLSAGETCVAVFQAAHHIFQLFDFHVSERIRTDHLSDLLRRMRMGDQLFI